MGPASLQIELKSVRRLMLIPFFIFFSEPILGPLEWTFGRRNAKKSVKKVDSTRHVARILELEADSRQTRKKMVPRLWEYLRSDCGGSENSGMCLDVWDLRGRPPRFLRSCGGCDSFLSVAWWMGREP